MASYQNLIKQLKKVADQNYLYVYGAKGKGNKAQMWFPYDKMQKPLDYVVLFSEFYYKKTFFIIPFEKELKGLKELSDNFYSQKRHGILGYLKKDFKLTIAEHPTIAKHPTIDIKPYSYNVSETEKWLNEILKDTNIKVTKTKSSKKTSKTISPPPSPKKNKSNYLSPEDAVNDEFDQDLPKVLRAIRERRGQQTFRERLFKEYGKKCMITGCTQKDAIEAAHIRPYSEQRNNKINNGLLLRADIHTLFDLNLLSIEPKTYEIAVHESITDQNYKKLAGKKLRGIKLRALDQDALEKRYPFTDIFAIAVEVSKRYYRLCKSYEMK